jgi:hypothetical protein
MTKGSCGNGRYGQRTSTHWATKCLTGRCSPHVPDLGVKQALLADDPQAYFTTPHFDGYPAILVRLDRIAVAELDE